MPNSRSSEQHATNRPHVRSELRAELAAYAYAVKHSPAGEDLTVVGDCLAAMNAIEAGLLNSASMHLHAEERYLRTVVANVRARTAITLFVKVKAHIGLTLNEQADATAALARKADKAATQAAPSSNAVLDLAGIPLKPIPVVTATGECIKPAAVAEHLCEVKVAQTRAEEENRLARVAVVNATYAAAVAAGAHPTKPRHNGPSLVHNAIKAATEQDIVKPSTFNHKSVRVPHRAR